ncbi:hypothetical protein GCM10009804_36610 [Kribbella hippodromi]|uniref:DUF4262 domain-containing protein n=1 Tax=Kribbella hippodromi TaxID=434347 RepID=A0ABN2DGE8_9ACTN
MSEEFDYHAVEPVKVLIDGVERECLLDMRSTPDSYWVLVLATPEGASWTGDGHGLWTAFLELRRRLDAVGYKLCCVGARRDANMRGGKWGDGDIVDVLSRRTLLGFQRKAYMFDYAPPGKVTTVDEQAARYDRWWDTPWWRALLPGDPVR